VITTGADTNTARNQTARDRARGVISKD